MKHTVTIAAGNVRDMSYVASRMRADDRDEVDAILPGWTPSALALLHSCPLSWTAKLDGNPEAVFGASERRLGLWSIFCWGTDHMWRCVPTIVDFGRRHVLPSLLDAGAHRAEALAMDGNRRGNGLLRALGATRRCDLPGYGVNGETFVLWDWTRDTVDVLQDAQAA